MIDAVFMQDAIDLERENVARGGQPFGAVLVQDGGCVANFGVA